MWNSTAKVFARDWVKKLQRSYLYATKYTTPFIAKLALDPALLSERNKIEKWFKTLPENVRPDIQHRLRSENSHQHFGAYYELVLYQFFKTIGYFVDIHPRLDGGEPDLLITGNNLEKAIVIEVATVFDDPVWQKEEQKLNQILEQLAKIEHYFLVHVSVESQHVPESVDYRGLKQFVTQWLDSFDPETTHEFHEIQYQAAELNLKLTLIPLKAPRKIPIIGGHMLPARFIGGKQLRRVLQQKINKYKSVKKLESPFVIAVSLAGAPLDEENIIDELFGKQQLTITRTQNGQVVEEKWGRSFSGLLTPKPGLGGKVQNTRLSAVVNIKSRWLRHVRQSRRVRREHSVSVIRNPYAAVPLGSEFLRGYPQFLRSSEDDRSITLHWVDRDSAMSFDC